MHELSIIEPMHEEESVSVFVHLTTCTPMEVGAVERPGEGNEPPPPPPTTTSSASPLSSPP
jgi:hypothetical protein